VCHYDSAGAVYIKNPAPTVITFIECLFLNNTSVRGAAIYFDEYFDPNPDPYKYFAISIMFSAFHFNKAHFGVIYVNVNADFPAQVTFQSSQFINNTGSCLFFSLSVITLSGNMLFKDNSAERGGAIYIDETSQIKVSDGAIIQFIDNLAVSYGGAIFVDLSSGCKEYNTFIMYNASIQYINSKYGFGSNSLYFAVPEYCKINLDYTNSNSLMHIPSQFNYTQLINGTTYVQIPYDYNYTNLKITHFPVITSPKQLKLLSSGYSIKYTDNL